MKRIVFLATLCATLPAFGQAAAGFETEDVFYCDEIMFAEEAAKNGCTFKISTSTIYKSWKLISLANNKVCHTPRAAPRMEGGFKMAWLMCTNRKPDYRASGEVYLSVKQETAFDCKNGKFATSRATYYGEALGNGPPVGDAFKKNAQKSDFDSPIPGTVGEAMMEEVCKK